MFNNNQQRGFHMEQFTHLIFVDAHNDVKCTLHFSTPMSSKDVGNMLIATRFWDGWVAPTEEDVHGQTNLLNGDTCVYGFCTEGKTHQAHLLKHNEPNTVQLAHWQVVWRLDVYQSQAFQEELTLS